MNYQRAAFKPISSLVPAFVYSENVPFFNILVPMVETTIQQILVENLMHAGYSKFLAYLRGLR